MEDKLKGKEEGKDTKNEERKEEKGLTNNCYGKVITGDIFT